MSGREGETIDLIDGLFETFSGIRLDVSNPDPSKIRLFDIAHHLAMANRYGGACQFPYSVAQHSVIMEEEAAPEFKLAAIFHDTPEYVIQDQTRPLKKLLVGYSELEIKWMTAINDKYCPGVDLEGFIGEPEFQHLDKTICIDEAKAVMRGNNQWGYDGQAGIGAAITSWHWAEARYLMHHRLLSHSCNVSKLPITQAEYQEELDYLDEFFSVCQATKIANSGGDQRVRIKV